MPFYIKIKNDRIKDVMCTGDEDNKFPEWIKAPDNFKGSPGDHLDWFTEDMVRIPDEKLIEMGKRFDKRGRWYSKTDIGSEIYISQLDQDPGHEWTKLPPIENEPFQKWDEVSKQWVINKKK